VGLWPWYDRFTLWYVEALDRPHPERSQCRENNEIVDGICRSIIHGRLKLLTGNLVVLAKCIHIFHEYQHLSRSRRTLLQRWPINFLEMNMQKKFLTALFIPLVATLAAQAAAASEHHHTRANDSAVLSEQVRNSNAYAAPGDFAVQSSLSDYDEGAMTSGLAGH
jgi:hypothetical protein